jgi:hypothetical protein
MAIKFGRNEEEEGDMNRFLVLFRVDQYFIGVIVELTGGQRELNTFLYQLGSCTKETLEATYSKRVWERS